MVKNSILKENTDEIEGITMSAALLLAACNKAEKKADAPTTFSYVYAIDPTTLDYSITSKSSTSDVIANLVDGLLENDKYGADGKSDGLTLIQDSIKGLAEYVSGETNDFSTVGVKAVDDYTVEYTLNKPESFWNSKVTTATMLPVNEEFLSTKRIQTTGTRTMLRLTTSN